jgi:Sap, sulfolipid-1-addressing protein
MLRRVGVAISVALADPLNPSTVGPALYLATVQNRVRRVIQFTIGVFSVTFAGGLVLMIGSGRLLLGLVPHPQRTVRYVIELVAGVVLLILAVALWCVPTMEFACLRSQPAHKSGWPIARWTRRPGTPLLCQPKGDPSPMSATCPDRAETGTVSTCCRDASRCCLGTLAAIRARRRRRQCCFTTRRKRHCGRVLSCAGRPEPSGRPACEAPSCV